MRIKLGRQGEDCAAEFLKKNGYQIIGRNVRAKFGEIDLVAKEGQTLCFVEVKTGSDSKFGFPEERILFYKQQRLIRLAQWYLQRGRLGEIPVRFDVVSILLGPDGSPARTRLIKGAFEVSR